MTEIYRDPGRSPRERAEDLLRRMTITEKIGQLNQRLYGFRIYERTGDDVRLTEEFCEEVERFGGMGALYGLYRADPWADKDETDGIVRPLVKKVYNMVQRYVLDHSRLGIPMLLTSECPHGHQALEGGLLPVNLAAGAAFDPALLEKAYEACGRELKACHVDLALMSVLDILRDPRWGRSEECYGEDPYLSSRLASAAVRGMHKAGVGVVAKHFCAQGETTGGVNASAARIGERELREIHFPAAFAVCKEKPEGVMAAYNEIDGTYCHANHWLLNDVLRQEMGFDGMVMADGTAVDSMASMTGSVVTAGALALRAGVDMSLWDTAYSRLAEALEQGLIQMEDIDRAVSRVLEVKFRLGLFEHPFLEEEMTVAGPDLVKETSLQLARESAVLLKNKDNLLPLSNVKRIALIGPGAKDLYYQLGDYTPPVRPEHGTTIFSGLKQAFAGAKIVYEKGFSFFEEDPDSLEAAVRAAETADVVIFVTGGSSSRFGGVTYAENGAAVQGGRTEMDCGEGVDCASLRIPSVQEDALKAVAETGTPVISVVLAGRPYVLETVEALSAAVLLCFYPGPMGGQAVAELLSGAVAPSGRLPVSLPRHTGQLPVYYNHKASYRAMQYYDQEHTPLHVFGEGMTYTDFRYGGLCAREKDDDIAVSFWVQNTGNCEGTAVPQLYVRLRQTVVTTRARELRAFSRVSLKAGEKQQIELKISREALVPWKNTGVLSLSSPAAEVILMDQGKIHQFYKRSIDPLGSDLPYPCVSM